MEDGGYATVPTFGTLLRRYRLAAGLSQEHLAERARLSLYGISALERGFRRTPQRETLELLIAALGLTGESRRAFEKAAARPALSRRRAGASITVGPWATSGSAELRLALTRFVGRATELNNIAALLLKHRFVTLTGAGGVGKTQTALRAAATVSDAREGVVCFVPLAPMSEPSLVTTAVATAVGVQEASNHPLLETVATFLKTKIALLVLDNCEHVIEETAVVADFLLRVCPNMRILATSREPLRVAGERTYRLPPLVGVDAVALFADRAQAADVHFALTSENTATVAKICEHLGGIPLAIELAAARVTILQPGALLNELDDRLGVLTGGDRTAPARHQTMRAAIDWSYDLLNAPEQRVFERLSIFAGGCTIPAARAVCESGDVAADEVLPVISSLVSKSLVQVDAADGESRFRLLEPFREYAREKLRNRNEETAVAHRHLLACLSLAEGFARRDGHYTEYYSYPRDEIGNWRNAVQWGLGERNDVLAAQRLVSEVVYLWGGTAPLLSDARRWIPAALGHANKQTPPELFAKLRLAEAHLAMHLDNHTLQLASADHAVTYYREAGDAWGLLRSQIVAGNARFDLGRTDEARVILEEALSIARKLGSRWHVANVLRNLACASRLAGDTGGSRTYLTEASQLLMALDDQVDVDLTIIDFASLASDEGNSQSAFATLNDLFSRGFDPCTPRRIIVLAKLDIAEYLIDLGRHEDARRYACEALRAAHEEQLEAYGASALLRLVTIAALRKKGPIWEARARAARILGFVDARIRALGSSSDTAPDPAITALREEMRTDAVTALIAEGAAMTEDEAIEAAIAL